MWLAVLGVPVFGVAVVGVPVFGVPVMGGTALSGALWLGLLWAGSGAGGSCQGKCCQGRDAACVGEGWREGGGYGTCYCDESCRRAGDCCHDHGQACPGRCGRRRPWRAGRGQGARGASARPFAVRERPPGCPGWKFRWVLSGTCGHGLRAARGEDSSLPSAGARA